MTIDNLQFDYIPLGGDGLFLSNEAYQATAPPLRAREDIQRAVRQRALHLGRADLGENGRPMCPP